MANNTQTLFLIRNEMAASLSPIAAVLGMFIVTGGFGNIMVILYYGIKEQTNPSFMFIVAMAICDVMVCFISMPLEIVDILEFYTFPTVIGCKILRFVNYFASCSSNNFLLAVAVDRYTKLCKPFGRQLSIRTTKITIATIFGLCLAAASPNFVFYDIVDINITQFNDVIVSSNVIGHDCKTHDEFSYYVMIYHGVLALLFLVITASLVVIYYNVVKEMVKVKNFRKRITATNKGSAKVNFENVYRKNKRKRENKTTCHTDVSCTECYKSQTTKLGFHALKDICIEMENEDNNARPIKNHDYNGRTMKKHGNNTQPMENQDNNSPPIKNHDNNTQPMENQDNNISPMKNHDNNTRLIENHNKNARSLEAFKENDGISPLSTEGQKTRNNQTQALKLRLDTSEIYNHKTNYTTRKSDKQIEIHKKTFTIIAISVTVAFIVSFLPFLVLMVWQTTSGMYKNLTGSELLAYQFFIRSWLLASVLNPVIYGFFNRHFRNFIKSLFIRNITE